MPKATYQVPFDDALKVVLLATGGKIEHCPATDTFEVTFSIPAGKFDGAGWKNVLKAEFPAFYKAGTGAWSEHTKTVVNELIQQIKAEKVKLETTKKKGKTLVIDPDNF